MITPSPQTQQARQARAWQHALRDAFKQPAELLRFLEIDPALPQLEAALLGAFPLRVPRGFAERMRKGDAADPLFLQIWPAGAEALSVEGFGLDAVGDRLKLKDGGIVHKYQHRVLVMATGACGVHCRYCFRRHFPYSEALAGRDHWREALAQIAADASISEVILSGGDPLALSDEKLAEFLDGLDGLVHVRRLRIHTRQPIVLPERVDDSLIALLRRSRLRTAIVLHANHANELDAKVAAACARLREAGASLLNQSVLLRRVNDNVAALQALSERLFDCGVLPYYLHLLDRVAGSAHFEVGEDRARALMRELSTRLPGYLLPRLARETAGLPAKEIIAW
ncbi:MAG: epmB [Hydrocarboniphaga sp.]|uniref:EF-P beta-lysylation protein EpmB n=1 Tax=Hydrocarboniphaga sp. TaxID=2033016 RepID=UPI0026067A9C|nr:EF-P beta-lysylation protein EpmB [Hydrocarboniphaga sp.]MDB5967639.1 epmB [Hydrocarboniphaga sp.]